MINFDFSAFLLFSTLGTGLVFLIDKFWFRKQRAKLGEAANNKEPIIIEYSRSFFPVLLLVLLLRSFLFEPFRIPSGSMKPGLLVGDFILVNKYTYGIRLPVIKKKIIDINQPERGDVMVFYYPVNPTEYFIKRVIGLPGDIIDYQNKQLYINGKLASKSLIANEVTHNESNEAIPVKHWQENIFGVRHEIYERFEKGREIVGITVPKGHYFMMGDNRDDSDDSRIWGFVPEENIVGKAIAVWMSWDSENFKIRFNTIPRKIH